MIDVIRPIHKESRKTSTPFPYPYCDIIKYDPQDDKNSKKSSTRQKNQGVGTKFPGPSAGWVVSRGDLDLT